MEHTNRTPIGPIYQTLYRKFRPQTFEDVLGQDETVQVLKNSLQSGRIGHAYLFCGPRGTGKTSCARIFAKALNCEQGPTSEPCGKCQMCESVAKGTSMDIIEIDAASNRGVDNIRDLREKVRFAPVQGKYKVYIIDEVHMLTGEAFNALLKTLEEPPVHTIFIMATTEPQKLPHTIISRCQRFDFRRITPIIVAEKLRKEATAENILVDDTALLRIAGAADGSFRDAESLLDQLYAYTDEEITEKDVLRLLGRTNTKTYFELFDVLFHSGFAELVSFQKKLMEQGTDIINFTKDMIAYSRDLFVLSVTGQNQEFLKMIPLESVHEYLPQAKSINPCNLIQLNEMLMNILGSMKYLLEPHLYLEVTLLKFKYMLLNPETTPQQKPIEHPSTAQPRKKTELIVSDNPTWNSFLDFVKETEVVFYTLLIGTSYVVVDEKTAEIIFPTDHEFNFNRLKQPANLLKLQKRYEEYAKKTLTFKLKLSVEEGSEKKTNPNQKILDDPIIIDTLKLFDATVQDVREIKGDN
jgi:DNA polymerase-3 subunit gamma/tau